MMGRFLKVGALVVSSLAVLFFFSSCGGTRNDEPLLNDQSFPSGPGATTVTDADSNASAEEAEVLKLLGITKEEESVAKPAAQQPKQAKVSDLQNELSQKDVEIENLKAAIAAKNQQIQNLERLKAERAAQATTSTSPSLPNVSSFQSRYNQALELYNNRRYRQAIALFDELLALNVSNDLVDNVQYWKGESYYGLQDYNQAALEFQKVFMYNDSNKLDDAQLKLGLCYLRLGDKERAIIEFRKVLDNYPDSEYVSRAQSYLDKL